MTQANGNGKSLSPQQMQELQLNQKRMRAMDLTLNILSARQEILRRMGGSARKDVDAECDYVPTVSGIPLDILKGLYDREPIATRIVEIYPSETWKAQPDVYEDEDSENETCFEVAWDNLSKNLRGEKSSFKDEKGVVVWDYLKRLDILAGIGSFGVMLLGIDDNLPLDQPVKEVMEALGCGSPQGTVQGADAQYGLASQGSTSSLQPLPPPKQENDKLMAEPTLEEDDSEEEIDPDDPTLGLQDDEEEQDSEEPFLEEGEEDLLDEDGEPVAPEEAKPSFKPKRKLKYLRVFDETLVQVASFEGDINNPRFGMPVMYNITFNDPRSGYGGNSIGYTTRTEKVHWTRVLHVADGVSTNEAFGTSRLKSPLNRLYDLRKVYGASAEGYWKCAFAGLAISTHPQLGGDVEVNEPDLKNQLENYFQGLDRSLYAPGMQFDTLAPQVSDPTRQTEICLEAICIVLRCPIRIFKGSERGELASSQDSGTWNEVISERRNNFVTPKIIVPFVDRLVLMGILPEVKEYFVNWPDANALNDKDKAMISSQKAQALSTYVQGGLQSLMTPVDFLTRIMGMEEEEAQAIIDAGEQQAAELEAQGIDPMTGQPYPPQIDPETGLPMEEPAIDPATGLPMEEPPMGEGEEGEAPVDEEEGGTLPFTKGKQKPPFPIANSKYPGTISTCIVEALVGNAWVTLDSGQHVYIDEDNNFLPRGPGSKPVPAIKLGAVAEKGSKAHSVYEAFGIKSPEQEAIERKHFETMALPKMRAYEKSSGVPWIERLLKASEGTHGTKGMTMQAKWNALVEGKLWGKSMHKLLKDEDFAHDYGSMTQSNLKKLVALLKAQGYRSKSLENSSNQAASNGMIHTLPPKKFKETFGFTPGKHDFAVNSLYATISDGGLYVFELIQNVFCPTGPGGGVDPTCSSSSAQTGKPWSGELLRGVRAQKGTVTDAGDYGAGEYWTADFDRAEAYTKPIGGKGKPGKVLKRIVSLNNPLVFKTTEEAHEYRLALVGAKDVYNPQSKEASLKIEADLRSKGHDGVIVYDANKNFTAIADKPFEVVVLRPVNNVFCPTGKGGGVDPSCGKEGKGSKGKTSTKSATITSSQETSHWGSEKQPYWRPGRNPTVDSIVTRDNPHTGEKEILLIQRGKAPFEGSWALPGGFHDTKAKKGEPWKPGHETVRQAALRELAEETGLDAKTLSKRMRIVGAYEGQGRDPRDNDEAWSATTAFKLHLTPELAKKVLKGDDDASDAKWFPVTALPSLAFDHGQIVKDAKLIKPSKAKKGKATTPATPTPEPVDTTTLNPPSSGLAEVPQIPIAPPPSPAKPLGDKGWTKDLFSLPSDVVAKKKATGTPAEKAKVEAYAHAERLASKTKLTDAEITSLLKAVSKMKLADLYEMRDKFVLMPGASKEKKAEMVKQLQDLFKFQMEQLVTKPKKEPAKQSPFGFLFMNNERGEVEDVAERIDILGEVYAFIANEDYSLRLTVIDEDEPVTNADNCGTGHGGFKEGNTCAKGNHPIPSNEAFDAKIKSKGFVYKGGPKGFKIATLDGKDYLIKSPMGGIREGSKVEALVADLAREAGVDVAPAAIRSVNGKDVVVSEWVQGGRALDHVDLSPEDKRRLLSAVPRHEIEQQTLFDYIVGNSDKHSGNYILAPHPDQGRGVRQRLVGIDKEFSLPRERGQSGTVHLFPHHLSYLTDSKDGLDFTLSDAEVNKAIEYGEKFAARLESQGMPAEGGSMRDRVGVLRRFLTHPTKDVRTLELLGMFGG